MMYVFDTSSFVVMNHYYPNAFPNFWAMLDQLVLQGILLSTREVRNELDLFSDRPHTLAWAKRNGSIFHIPSREEQYFVAKILATPPFQALIGQKALLKGTPVADPFIVAAAKIKCAKVVTQESFKEKSAKIPTVCAHFGVPWTNLEGFLQEQGKVF